MAIEKVEMQLINPGLYDVSARDSDGSAVSFRWNESTGMEGLKTAYNRAKAGPVVDEKIEGLKTQALTELNK